MMFYSDSRGLVLGVWSACASVGNIIGSLIVSALVGYGYEVSIHLIKCLNTKTFSICLMYIETRI